MHRLVAEAFGELTMKRLRRTGSATTFVAALALVASAWGVSLLLPTTSSAQPSGGSQQGQQGQRQGPAPEALAACKSLSSGAACSFGGARGSVSGTCLAPQGRELACRSKDAPVPGGAASAPRQ
jgi:hypothetical protein